LKIDQKYVVFIKIRMMYGITTKSTRELFELCAP